MDSQSVVLSSKLFELMNMGNIVTLKNHIDKLIESEGDAAIIEVNSFFSMPANLSFLIKLILKNSDMMKSVLDESYYHENGFHKLVMLSGKNFKLRLHHFGNNVRIPMENVHDHRWAFASTILSGELKMKLFKANKRGGEPVIHYKYDSNKISGKYETFEMGKTHVKVIKEKVYKTGEQYFMGTSDLHRITNNPFEESITLILTGMPISNVCNLYASRPINQAEKTPAKYDSHILTQMLKSLSEKIYPQYN